MRGWRKYSMAIISLASFTAILIISDNNIDPLNLGLGIAFINGSYAGANAMTHFAEAKMKNKLEEK